MSRSVRMVPRGWEHPRNERGNYKPLHDDYEENKAGWLASLALIGLQATLDDIGTPPDQNDYMPTWEASECVLWMMYEECSEGTPISPGFETPEELARWLADNKASAFGGMTATYEQWLATCLNGAAPGMFMRVGPEGPVLASGVELAT